MRLNGSEDTRRSFGFRVLAGEVKQPAWGACKLNLFGLTWELVCSDRPLSKLPPPSIHVVQFAARGAGQRNNGHLRFGPIGAADGVIADAHLIRGELLPTSGKRFFPCWIFFGEASWFRRWFFLRDAINFDVLALAPR